MIQQPNLEKLLDHLSQTVYEGILKLGTVQTTAFSIYYDLDLMNYLLQTQFSSNEECSEFLLKAAPQLTIGGFPIEIRLQKGRFQCIVPGEALSTIFTTGEKNGFLREIIALAATHHYNLEDVKKVFSHYSNDYVCEEIENGEFQAVLYFKDEAINHYKYCFAFDEFGGYYHRLLDYDYQKVINE